MAGVPQVLNSCSVSIYWFCKVEGANTRNWTALTSCLQKQEIESSDSGLGLWADECGMLLFTVSLFEPFVDFHASLSTVLSYERGLSNRFTCLIIDPKFHTHFLICRYCCGHFFLPELGVHVINWRTFEMRNWLTLIPTFQYMIIILLNSVSAFDQLSLLKQSHIISKLISQFIGSHKRTIHSEAQSEI